MVNLKINPSTINTNSDMAHGTYHLADNPALYEIQRSNNFEFIVDPSINGILYPGTVEGPDAVHMENAQEILRLSVDSASVPHFSQEPISVRRGNNELKFAGVPTFDSGSISVIDYIGADTKAILMAWQNLSYNVKTEKVGLATDYKKDCWLVEYSPDYQVVRKWLLHGCWVSRIQDTEFSASSSNSVRKLTVTIPYDSAELDTSDI